MTSSPRILIIGKQGQVGWELQRALLPIGKVVAMDRKNLDLTDHGAIRRTIQEKKPDVIINAAAYTAVDRAEEEAQLAMQINGVAPGILAEEARRQGALLLHYSTDYVFDGSKPTPYIETDTPSPINIYGKTKLAGEQAIQTVAGDHIILRTSWVYGNRGKNFLLTMLKLMRERESLRVIDDQQGTPTWSKMIAQVTAHIIWQSLLAKQQDRFRSDLYHLTSNGDTTWYGFAGRIAEIARKLHLCDDLSVNQIDAINTEDYPAPAKRPGNSRMSVAKLQQQYRLTIPVWDEALMLCMQEMK